MSHLAATLLLHVHEPHLACACLHALLAGYPVLRACASLRFGPPIAAFDSALRSLLPALAAHLDALDVRPDLYLVPWLLTAFARSLPLAIAARVWDRMLSEGGRALLRAALALLRILQPKLLAAGYEDAVRLLHALPPISEEQLATAMAKVHLPDDDEAGRALIAASIAATRAERPPDGAA